MIIRVPIDQAPFTRDRLITLVEDGVPKVYPVVVKPPTQWDKRFAYVLPDYFPREVVKVIFGAEPEVRL